MSFNRRGLVALDEHMDDGVVDVRGWHPQWVAPSDDLPTIAVSPIFTNPRMTAQRSAFMLTGDSFLPLEEQFDGRLIREGLLVKVELPPEGFDEVEDYLRVAGLSAFTYFPDLEGLALDHEARVVAMLGDTQKFFPAQVKKNDGAVKPGSDLN